MSFQYYNPYIANIKTVPYQQTGYQIPVNYAQAQQNYQTNPYQYGFYNSNITYPYSPIMAPCVNGKYLPMGYSTTPNGEIIHLFRLANGHKVAIVPRENEATIVKTFLNAGSINETDNTRGISHCIEHFLFNGSSRLKNGDVFRLTGLMGASTNASTDFAKVDYYITAPMMSEENLKKTIEIQGDMISNPTFDKDAIEAEKGPICSEISMIGDNPVSYGFDKVIRNLFRIDSNSENMVAGSIDTVKNLSQNQIKEHHDKYYDPNDLYTVVVGEVDVNKTIEEIANNFTLKPKNISNTKYHEKLTPIEKSIREDVKSPKTNRTYVLSAFKGPLPKDSKDWCVIGMINRYLKYSSTSKLNKDLKEQNGYFDYEYQKVGLKDNNPYAIINIMELNPNDSQSGIDSYYDAIQKLQNEYLSDEDINALKKCIKKNYSVNECDSEDVCDSVGISLMEGTLNSYSNKYKILDSVTKEDILEAAKKYYDLNKVSMMVIHPENVSDEKIQADYDKSKYSLSSIKKRNINNAVAVSFCGKHAKKAENVKQYKLQNNTHLAINNTNSNLCVFNWSIDTPPIKPKNPNIPKILQYIFDEGTDSKNRDEITRYLELNGINTDVYINGKSINIAGDCMPESINQTLAIMNEILYHPKFTEKDFEKAKKILKEDLELSEKDAKSNLLDKIFPGFFPTDSEMLKELDKLTLDDVVEFYNDLLKNASSKMVATIPVEKSPELAQSVISYQSIPNVIFKENIQKFTPIFKENENTQVVIDTDKINQAQIYKTYQFPMSGNVSDEAKFEIVNLILGGTANSRLFMDLREKQNLAYAVSSSVQSFENTGVLTMKIQTTTDYKDKELKTYDNVEKSLEGFKEHTDKICNELVTDEELEAAKTKLKQSLIGQCQNPYSETTLLSINISEPMGIERIDKYFDAIDSITKEDIRNAARHIFSYKPTISILASEDTINSQMDYLSSLGETIRV